MAGEWIIKKQAEIPTGLLNLPLIEAQDLAIKYLMTEKGVKRILHISSLGIYVDGLLQPEHCFKVSAQRRNNTVKKGIVAVMDKKPDTVKRVEIIN